MASGALGESMDSKDVILNSRVSIDSDIPLYYQIISIIKRSVSVGLLKPGDIIPSETELCDALNISRSTVRQAIGELESEGLVVRRRGKGTFISEPKLSRTIEDVYSFSNEMRRMGHEPSSIVHCFERIHPPEEILKSLELKDERQDVFKIVRLRCANGEPLLLETTIIPYHIMPGLTRESLKKGSLYTMLKEEADMVPHMAEETYETMVIDEKTAKILQCKSGIGGFFVERRTWSRTGEIYELTQSVIRGDRTKFLLKLKSNSVSWDRNFLT
jgi:GntR family transcriptional regulator